RHLPRDAVVRRAAKAVRVPLTSAEWRRIRVILLLLFVPYMVYGAVVFQSYAIMYIWADTRVDRTVLGFEMPVTWIGIFDGIATIAGTWLGNRLSLALIRRRGRDVGDVAKFGIGMAGVAAAWLFAVAIAGAAVTPVLLWMAFYLFQDFSYGAFIEPQVQSLVSRDSPPSVMAMMMSMIKASAAASYIFAGWLARYYEPLGPQAFFGLLAAIAAAAAVVMIVPFRWWVRRLGPVEQKLEA
ncbi:MAG: hypothetical protein ABIT09_00330, partial [Croceibacterium sp.]